MGISGVTKQIIFTCPALKLTGNINFSSANFYINMANVMSSQSDTVCAYIELNFDRSVEFGIVDLSLHVSGN